MFYEVILNYFPYTKDQESYFGSSYRLYSKKGKRNITPQKGIIPKTISLKSSAEFFGELKIEMKNVTSKIKPNHYLLLKTVGKIKTPSPLYYVATLERNGEMIKNGNDPLFYQAYDQSKLSEIGINTKFTLAFDLPKEALPNDVLKIYFWNPEKKEVEIGETKLYFIKD